jgi:signal transduction histidine kinase/ActR/RegA family two-component response regulator/HAMP domain-containing protein
MRFSRMPLQRRLMAIALVTSGAVLLLTSAFFSAYEIVGFLRTTVQQLETTTAIIAQNCTAVLAFDDRAAAADILSALKATPHVTQAALYDVNGRLFAVYPKDLAPSQFPPAPQAEGHRFENGFLIQERAVTRDERRLGVLYVKEDTKAVAQRIRLYGGIAAAVAGVAFLLASVLSTILQRQIVEPILALADTARTVTDRRNYSVRAPSHSRGEVGVLATAFNQMLTQIQEQLGFLELLNRITQAIGERLDLTSMLSVMLSSLEDNFPVRFVGAGLYRHDTTQLELVSVGAKSAELAVTTSMTPGSVLELAPDELQGWQNSSQAYEPDLSHAQSPFAARIAKRGMRSLVVSALRVESNNLGVLIAAREQADGFSVLDREFLRQLAEHTALAVHQANLYGELQQAYSELRLSQQAVMQQERLRALGQMAMGIAHDINNAILPAALYTESLLEQETNLSPVARENLRIVSRAIEDVAATVGRMREFFRQRPPQVSLAEVHVNRSIQAVIDLTRARWSDTPQQRGVVIKVATDLSPDDPVILGIEGEVREALTNVFFNSFDAMPDGGTMTVRTRTMPDRRVQIQVIDTGVGMDEATRRRCLEPFYTTKGERGTGLGLAMVYGIAERHGASLEVGSTPGKGTTFTFLFPEAPPVTTMVSMDPTADARSSRLHILVTDDEPLIAKVLAETLRRDGHLVETANGGQAGIDAFTSALDRGAPFDVVITDLGMPYVDGRKVAAAVKARSAHTPVILLTGWGQSVLAEGEAIQHIDRLLAKPPKLADLREALAGCTVGGDGSVRPAAP